MALEETSGAGAVEGEAGGRRGTAAVTVRIFCCHTCPCWWQRGNNWLRRMRLLQMTFWHASWASGPVPVPPWGPASHPSYAENCEEKRAAKLIDRSSAVGGRERGCFCFCFWPGCQHELENKQRERANAHTSNWPTIATFSFSGCLPADRSSSASRQRQSLKETRTKWAELLMCCHCWTGLHRWNGTGPVPLSVPLSVLRLRKQQWEIEYTERSTRNVHTLYTVSLYECVCVCE